MTTTIKFYEIGFQVANFWSVVATYLDEKRATEAVPEHFKDVLPSFAEKLVVRPIETERIYKGELGKLSYSVYVSYSTHPLATFDVLDSAEVHAAKLIESRPDFKKFLFIK